MKMCFKCGRTLHVDAFYKHSAMKDGRLGKCKECTKEDVRKNYRENIDKYKKYEKMRSQLPHRIKLRENYAKTEEGRIAKARGSRAYDERNPIKKAAHIKVGNAIKRGLLSPSPCEVCSTTNRVQAHHDDYEKPLDVRWLCKKHHDEVHWGKQA